MEKVWRRYREVQGIKNQCLYGYSYCKGFLRFVPLTYIAMNKTIPCKSLYYKTAGSPKTWQTIPFLVFLLILF